MGTRWRHLRWKIQKRQRVDKAIEIKLTGEVVKLRFLADQECLALRQRLMCRRTSIKWSVWHGQFITECVAARTRAGANLTLRHSQMPLALCAPAAKR